MDKGNFILDTSVIIAYLADEKSARDIAGILPRGKIPFICLSEFYYIIWNKRGKSEADRIYGLVKSWDLPVLFPNESVILNAGRFKAEYKLGISDSYIAAFALDFGYPLATKDKDYEVIKNEIEILMFS